MGALPELEGPQRRTLTVSELTALIKDRLESSFAGVYVVGEISRIQRAGSGHLYLTLKDERAVLSAVMWRGPAAALRFEPREGVQIVAHGSLDVYPPRGSYQLVIVWMEPRGVGALQLAFRQLMEKLEKEGLFRKELKRPLPSFPRKIGIVTSPTGAAIRDIINVIGRRYPLVELWLMPARVQGEGAAQEIAAAIATLNRAKPGLDLMIVGRGGGSLEDLWPFNEEVVARAVRGSAIPVVSAVGHEVDFSVSDFAADVRAATPTEAGEIVVPDAAELRQRLLDLRARLARDLAAAVERGRRQVHVLTSRFVIRHPEAALNQRAQELDDLVGKLRALFEHYLALLRHAVDACERRIEGLSPLRVLERGYSLTFGPDGRLLRSVAGLSAGVTITTRLSEGEIVSDVKSVRGGIPSAPQGPDA